MKYLLSVLVGLASIGSGYLAMLLMKDVASYMSNGSILDPAPMEILELLVVANACSVISVMTVVLFVKAVHLLYVAIKSPGQSQRIAPYVVIS